MKKTSSSKSHIRDKARDTSNRQSFSLMYGLSVGHGMKHFGQGALLVMSPSIKATLGLTEVALGGLFSMQTIASGIANIPAGILSDIYRKRIALILFSSMVLVALGYLILGISSWYWMTVSAVTLLGFGTSLWHAPAFGTLAARYPERKGLALAAHLSGAQVGNTISPIIIGFLLGGTILGWKFGGWDWQFIAMGLSIPMLITGLSVLIFFRSAGVEVKENPSFSVYIISAKALITNFRILGMVFLGACRGAVHTAFQIFLVLHMKEVLDYSNFVIGLHVALITLAGIVSTPIMGLMSDKFGRKPVITIAMGTMSILIFMFMFFDSGLPMTILIALLGVFFFSVMPIITAATMDQVPAGMEGSGTALMFAGLAIIGAISPLFGGFLYEQFLFKGVIVYSTAIATFGTFLSIILPMSKKL
ncbi:MFS transporter [Dehalococcoidia bacterium]|nr:MFS transporter [Dehalococcoidia bacterium]